MAAQQGKTFEDVEIEIQRRTRAAIKKKWIHRIRKKLKKLKHKKKLEVMFGYQLSNLGWIGAWIAADKCGLLTIQFILAATLICVADVLILWKEV